VTCIRIMEVKTWFAVSLLVVCAAARTQAQSIERLEPAQNGSDPEVALHANAQFAAEGARNSLRLPRTAYAAWTPHGGPTSDAGTIIMWVKPLWQPGDQRSHVFLTFPWSGSDQSYFALSQGWWEPEGAHRLVAVFSNQDQVACQMPWNFEYTLYLPDQWTLLSVTWRSGKPGYLGVFVDGKLICQNKSNFSAGRRARGPLYLGSDLGAPVAHGERRSDMLLDDVQIVPRSMSGAEMRRLYLQRQGDQDPKWIRAIVGSEPAVPAPGERRIMQDEDTRWASSRLEMRTRIERIKAAGFNVYMPNVWDGGTAYYAARNAPVAPSSRDAADPNYDALAYLIALAHHAGIAVHPWFIMVRHPSGTVFPSSYLDGAPVDAFNVQSADFRNFVVALVDDVAVCSNPQCVDAYARKYDRSLARDWQAQLKGEKIPSLIEWNAAAVTDIVQRISAGVRKFKPHAILSIDANPLDHGSRHEGLDEERWLLDGTIDALVDMTYDDPLDVDGIDRAIKAYSPGRLVINVRNYDLFDDSWANRSARVMSDYVLLIRKRWPGAGIGFYQYAHMDAQQREGLRGGVFAEDTRPDWRGSGP
jgi:hypothetical protein